MVIKKEIVPTNFHGIYTTCPRVIEIFKVVKKVADTNFSVMVRGETGSGKELVARAIHQLSQRNMAPYQVINCAALSPELIMSELFGHMKGSFTGAVHDHKGLFEVANGGSLFLDEVGELPLQIQSRLLRVIEDKTYTRLGSTKSRSADVRFISATNRSLRKMVEEKIFREDLMYRLRVVPIFLPPLRERGDDIKVLSELFINEINAVSKRNIKTIHPKAIDALMAYRWPGNIRELRNNIEYAFAIGTSTTLTLDDLTPELRGENPHDTYETEKAFLDSERKLIQTSMQKHRGRRQMVSKELGMSRTTLWRKLKQYGLI